MALYRLRTLMNGVRRHFEKKAIRYEDVYLPPKQMRFCDKEWQDDDYFVESALNDVGRLVQRCGLSETCSLLDIGSGQGRLAIGLIRRFGRQLRDYRGIDVSKTSVEWCQKWITRYHPNYAFTHVDIRNERYNPSGKVSFRDLRFPFEDRWFDAGFLYSVFTHMRSDDIAACLQEMHRVIKPKGKVLLTAFVEENVPNESENPAGYLESLYPARGPLHKVRFEKGFFEALLRENGFMVEHFDHASEGVTGQSCLTISNCGD